MKVACNDHRMWKTGKTVKPPFKAYSGSDAFIFVCYSHKNKEQVYPELVWLKDQGLNIWYDEGISPGEEWPEKIAWAIENADKILFYVSPDSTQSRICRDEIRLARTAGIPIVTVQLKHARLRGGIRAYTWLIPGNCQKQVSHFRRLSE